MKTFSINKNQENLINLVTQIIEENKGYLIYFNNINSEEIKATILNHIARTYEGKEDRENLEPYIKNLIRNIGKDYNPSEIAVSTVDEESGEVSREYLELKTEDKYVEIDLKEELIKLYLLHPVDFKNFTEQFTLNTKIDKIENPDLYKRLLEIIRMVQVESLEKEIALIEKQLNRPQSVEKEEDPIKLENKEIPEDKLGKGIKIKGKIYYIDEEKLITKEDLDNYDWTPRYDKTTLPMCYLDIDKYIDMLYNRIYVEKGIENDYINWFEENYILIDPSEIHRKEENINKDREEFIEEQRKKLIRSIANANRIKELIAITTDRIYYLPTRKKYNKYLTIQETQEKEIKLEVKELNK